MREDLSRHILIVTYSPFTRDKAMLVYFEVNFGIFETSSGFFVDMSFGFFVGIVDIEVTPVFGSGWILGTSLRVATSPLKKRALNTMQRSSEGLGGKVKIQ